MIHNLFQRTKNNSIIYFQDGLKYQSHYLDLIQHAKKNIHLQTYIFELDEFGTKVYNELISAAARGIDIYILVDSIGSRPLTIQAEEKLKAAGIHFYRFNNIQIKWLYSWGRRLHHKVLLVDEEIAFVGGININTITDHQTGVQQLDFALLLRGPVLIQLTQYLQIIYKKTSGNKKLFFPPPPTPPTFQDGVDVKILINDWVYRRWQITRQYSLMTTKAKREITIINSYFFPRRVFMRQLVEAARRGVKVRLILPKLSDWPSYILASEFLYAYFLKNGVEIYQWKKSILHGKLATIDDEWSTIGSFNLNYTSYQQNLEMNVNVYSESFTKELKGQIEHLILTGCEKINAKDFLIDSPFHIKVKRLLYYLIVAIVANFSIGMIYQEDDDRGNRIYNLIRIIGALFFLSLGIIGILLPVIPAIPFFAISFLLIFKQILLNRKKETL